MTTQIDLTRFCSTERTSMARPVVFGGFRYATNGAIVIRTATADADALDLPDWVRSSSAWFSESPLMPTDEAWPEAIEQPTTCDECSGVGTVEEVDCDECNGTGISECWECGHEGDCAECDGSGVQTEAGECPKCEGRKVIHPNLPVSGLLIDGKFDAAIRELPNVRVVGRSIGGKALRATFDGGELILMGLRNS